LVYPKKKKRAEAWKNWQSFKPPVDLVMDALAWQVEQHDWTKEDGKFVPKAADWIEDAGWTAKPPTGASRPLSKIEQKTEEHREMFVGGREWANR
jgi:DNA replication protein DnaC